MSFDIESGIQIYVYVDVSYVTIKIIAQMHFTQTIIAIAFVLKTITYL